MVESLALAFKEMQNEGMKGNSFDLPEFVDSMESKDINSYEEADRPLYENEYIDVETAFEDVSDGERKVYEDANLEVGNIEGRDCLQRTDIDYNEKVGPFGETNLELMSKGRAPINKNGERIELHHIGQKMESPLAELTQQEHRGKGNDGILHDKNIESVIDRAKFKTEKENYWKARAAEIKNEGGV